MTPDSPNARARGPALLCYDGSDPARRAIEHAGTVIGGGAAIVLTVWESLGSAVLRHPLPGSSELAREVRGVAGEVVTELDTDAAERAKATAAEGAEIAAVAGFDAQPWSRRALGRAGERADVTVWQAVLEVADEGDVAVVVLGSRGRSGMQSMLLGSVSYGLVHNSSRPLLIVPGP